MGSINKVQLLGYVGKDPEIRKTNDGREWATFSVATSESWRDKYSGEKKELTEWHNIVCFNENVCEIIEKYVNKGDQIIVEGQMRTRKYQDKDGNDRYSTEVVISAFNGGVTLLNNGRSNSGHKPTGNPEDYGLDGDRAAGTRRGDSSQESGGGDYGRSSGSTEGKDSTKGGAAYQPQMDDDIPF